MRNSEYQIEGKKCLCQQIGGALQDITNNYSNNINHNVPVNAFKCKLLPEFAKPEPKPIIHIKTAKPKEAYNHPIQKRNLETHQQGKPYKCITTFTKRNQPLVVPVYKDEEVGFGSQWKVRNSDFDDDHETPFKLISDTKLSVFKGIEDCIHEIYDIGVHAFLNSLRSFNKYGIRKGIN